jgi:hypothetical protein
MGQDSGWKIAAVRQNDLGSAVSDHMGVGDDQSIRMPDGAGATTLPATTDLYQAVLSVVHHVSHFHIQLL